MSPMQLFHNSLFQTPEVYDPYMLRLAQLTETPRETVAAIDSGFDWVVWGATLS